MPCRCCQRLIDWIRAGHGVYIFDLRDDEPTATKITDRDGAVSDGPNPLTDMVEAVDAEAKQLREKPR